MDRKRVFIVLLSLTLVLAAANLPTSVCAAERVLFTAGEETVQTAQPVLKGYSFSLSFESEILVNFYYTIQNPETVTEQGMLVFYADPGTADIAAATDVYTNTVYTESSGLYANTTSGIAAKEMGDSRYYCAYAKCTDGTYVYSPLYQYSPKKYAVNMLGKSTTTEKQKALCVAMLNYGAAAQSYFGYKADDLMNASLTADQQAMVVGYDAGLFVGAVAADASKTGNFPRSATGFSKRTATVSFEGAFVINYYFTPNVAVSGDISFYYWTPEAYAAASTLTTANASGSCAMVAVGDGSYWAELTGIPAKQLDDTYYVAGVYTDASGNAYCTGVIAYSLSKYCLNNDSGDMGALAQATAMYGYYAKSYFGGTNAPVITKPTLIVSTVNAAPGTTGVEVMVEVVKNPGIAGMTLAIEYDDTVLTLTKVTTKDALSGLTFQKPKTYKNGCNLVWYGAEPNAVTDGNAFQLVFTVSDTAAPGTYPINLVYSSGYDASLGSIDMDVTGGSIVVTG